MRIEESQGSTGPQNGHVHPAKAAPTAEQILGEIRDYCRADAHGRIHLRAAGGQRRQAGVAVARRRQDHDRHARQGPCLSRRAPARFGRRGRAAVTGRQAAERRGRRQRRRAGGLPILRQPPEIPAVRLDLQREDRDRPPHLARARQSAAGAAGAAHLRCRRRRRHRAVAGDAGGACALPHHAALRGGEGDQLRRRPPDAGEDGGPTVRASRHRAGRDQSLLRRGAVADAAFGDISARPDLEGRHADRQHRTRLRRADRRARRFSRRELARRHQPDHGQSGLPAPGRS